MSNYIKTIDKLYTSRVISSKQLNQYARTYKNSSTEERNKLDSTYREIFKDELGKLQDVSAEMLKINHNVSTISFWVQFWSYLGILSLIYTVYNIIKTYG
jgi:hypothetical protein